ncbi:MAG: cupin domain-containing protein [Nitrospinaceae bacterium]|nr:cupin domain-containing protein [Nitrospinaceae bacterium]NIR53375.1 cupin domain-containing protein [Nitrospinaceae bacterium]NIS83779.1 cupin domain-containing protein [Nitrospinaceae bacterium]NIT80578.1 cupin domain-containing protein [Nitrospinaceae bacterium]NIU42899.1 cupin domain-containing protein [Nitrospinaceae bacterium]
MDQKQIAGDWAQRGFSCDLWTDPPGQVWQDFVHSVDERVVVVEGELEWVMDGKTFYPEPGQEVFIPAQAVHTVRNIGDSTAHWLYGYRKT